jgi:hypothetical protein
MQRGGINLYHTYLTTLITDYLSNVNSLVDAYIEKSNDSPLSVSVNVDGSSGKVYIFILMQGSV